MHAAFPSPRWAQLRQDGVALIQAARFGRWRLPPDWLDVSRADGSVRPADSFPQRFSWDAVRVPLFLAWSGLGPDVVTSASAFWRAAPRHPPAWVDLKTGMIADYAAPAGIEAIGKVAMRAGAAPRDFPATTTLTNDSYYSAALTLLSRLAWSETSVQR